MHLAGSKNAVSVFLSVHKRKPPRLESKARLERDERRFSESEHVLMNH